MASGLSIYGERESGQDVRTNNVNAVLAIANIVKNTLGPQGLDKMLVDEIGDVTITNDGATILKQLEVEHPAAKVIVQLSQLQDKEVGDGTTSVVILASELLKRANELIKYKVHPTTVISGFKLAAREATKYINEHLSAKTSDLGKDALINTAKTSMSSKLINTESDFFAEMVIEALETVQTVNYLGDVKYPIKAVNIVKNHGKSSLDSKLIKGYAIQMMRCSQQMPTKVSNAKIACLDMNLSKFKLHLGVMVQVDDPKSLDMIRQRERTIIKDRISKIIKAGAKVIITTKGIDDVAEKIMIENNCLGLRRVAKSDLRRIAKASGATIVNVMADAEGEEIFESSYLGSATEVYEESVGDNDFIFFNGFKNQTAATIMLRGSNEIMLDEIERSVHDSICAVKRVMESGKVVAGGGAVETALNVYLEDFAKTMGTKEQIAIAEFAEALSIIPKTLAVNAALDATDLISKLKVFHSASQNSDDEKRRELKWCGLDLLNGKVRNNLKAGVLEPAEGKVKCIRFATECAITILRIDDMIKLAPKEEDMQQRH